MSYGQTVGDITRTRSYVQGQHGAGFALTKAQREAQAGSTKPVDAKVSVEATWDGAVYTLVIESDSHRGTVTNVEPQDLATEIGRVINLVRKAAVNGDLAKHRQRDNLPSYGLGQPRPNRDALTF